MKHLILLFCFSTSAFAFGPIGHRVVAEIAQQKLSPKKLQIINEIIAPDKLPDLANWPDMIRSDPAWRKASPWHYVSIEDKETYAKSKKNPEGDVITAIQNFKKVVTNKKSTKAQKKEAIAFLTHFIGDLHQPLHVGRASDRGGNTITLKWFGRKTNLHEIWDDKMIEMEQLSYTEYVLMINKADPKLESQWAKDSLMTWIEESQKLRPLVYSYPAKATKYWEYEYRYKMQNILNERLLKAGIRLAATLEDLVF